MTESKTLTAIRMHKECAQVKICLKEVQDEREPNLKPPLLSFIRLKNRDIFSLKKHNSHVSLLLESLVVSY